MDPVLRYARQKQNDIIATIRTFVECESPSDDPPSVNGMVDLIADNVNGFAKVRTFPHPGTASCCGANSLCQVYPNQDQRIAARPGNRFWRWGIPIPFGRSEHFRPCRSARSAEGSGDPAFTTSKAGIAFFIWAMRALRDLDVPVARTVILQVNPDEETGSRESRPYTEDAARKSEAVLVLEPSIGLTGKLKTARKGVGGYDIVVHGRAAHMGVDPENGASAIVEMARQIERIVGFGRPDRGVTVGPGVILGGTRSNVVAAECSTEIDIRVPRTRDFAALDRKFQSLKPFDTRCKIQVTGGLNRPPLERTAGVRKLFAKAKALASEIDLVLEEGSTGGGSDGNFTAAVGTPTLDGLGAVGEGAHALNESILLNQIAPAPLCWQNSSPLSSTAGDPFHSELRAPSTGVQKRPKYSVLPVTQIASPHRLS